MRHQDVRAFDFRSSDPCNKVPDPRFWLRRGFQVEGSGLRLGSGSTPMFLGAPKNGLKATDEEHTHQSEEGSFERVSQL